MKVYLSADTGASYTGARYLRVWLGPWIRDGRDAEAVRWRTGRTTDKELKREILDWIRGGVPLRNICGR